MRSKGAGAGQSFRLRQDRHPHARQDAGGGGVRSGSVGADRLVVLAAAIEQGSAPGCCRPARRRVRRPCRRWPSWLPRPGRDARRGRGRAPLDRAARAGSRVSPARACCARVELAAPGGTVIALAGRAAGSGLFRLGDSLRADAPMITVAWRPRVRRSACFPATRSRWWITGRRPAGNPRRARWPGSAGQATGDSSTCSATTGRSWR